MAEFRAGTAEQQAFLAELLERRVLIDSAVPGLFGRSRMFEELRQQLIDAVRRLSAADEAERMMFPPLIPRRQMEDLGYFQTFPHLAGTVFGFGGEDGRTEQATDMVLNPAACYPVYPAIAARGPVPADGVTVEVSPGCVFRHEPSDDPARMQCFHMIELVRIAPPDVVVAWRDHWRDRAVEFLRSLGLQAEFDVAADPFFGRGGRMLARGQREQQLKFEILVPLGGEERTAVASFNYHQAHFAEVHGLVGEDGEPVHTACLGFGQERVVLALLHEHGLDPASWPSEVRAVLAGSDG